MGTPSTAPAAERSVQRLSALGTLVASVAHELNNPNNMIQLNAEYLRQLWGALGPVLATGSMPVVVPAAFAGLSREEALEAVPQAIDDIIEGAGRIALLLGQLRDHVSGGRGQRTQFEPGELVAGALRGFACRPGDPLARVRVVLEPALPLMWGDRSALERVLINLLDNALDACAEQEGEVEVAVRRAGSTELEITVSDTGPGVPPALAARIFDCFVSTKRARGGSGLGLFIARQVLEEHGGEIALENVEPTGARFRARLPLERRTRHEHTD